MSPIKFENRYVAFLDILGFKDVGEKAPYEESYRHQLTEIIQVIESRRGFDEKHHPYIWYLFISDSIIIVCDQLQPLCWKISQICDAFVEKEYPVRGAITYGKVFLREEGTGTRNIVGPAYQEAYRLQEDMAIYPRVILSKSIIPRLQEIDEKRRWLIETDKDGWKYINVFQRRLRDKNPTADTQYFLNVKRVIESKLNVYDVLGKEAIYAKWYWLAVHFNRLVAASSYNSVIGVISLP